LLWVSSVAPGSIVPVITIRTVNWSVYILAGSHFTGVTGTFNVPTPTGSASCVQQTAVWVGVDGLHNHDLLQAGVWEGGSRAGQPELPPVGGEQRCLLGASRGLCLVGGPPLTTVRVGLPVRAGDKVSVPIFEISPGWWAVAVHELTTVRALFLSQPYDGPQASVEWVVEAPQVMGMFYQAGPLQSCQLSLSACPGPRAPPRARQLRLQGELRQP
jgi:hypothetical protein